MKRVVMYLRLSDEDNNKLNKFDESESIKNQRILVMEEVNKHEGWLLTDEYVDENISGAGTYRPEFERMIDDAKNGLIDIIISKSQSRFSRDMEIIEKYLHNLFIEWGVRFIGLSDNADTDNYGNKKARQINGLVNEWYLEDLSNNIKTALKAKMINGEFISPFACYGYIVNPNNNNTLLVDKIPSLVVKKIYNLYINGHGYTSICNILNNYKIPSPGLYKFESGSKININTNNIKKLKWNINTIKTILTNEIYTGSLIQGKRKKVSYKGNKVINNSREKWVKKECTHEEIISYKKWVFVQNLISKNTRKNNKYTEKNILKNYVFCGSCNKELIKKNNGKYFYLKCMKCHTSIRYDKIINIIENEVNKNVEKYYTFNKNITKNHVINSDKYIKELYIDKVNKKIDDNTFNNLLNSFKNDNKIVKSLDYKIPVNNNINLFNIIVEKVLVINNNISIIWKF